MGTLRGKGGCEYVELICFPGRQGISPCCSSPSPAGPSCAARRWPVWTSGPSGRSAPPPGSGRCTGPPHCHTSWPRHREVGGGGQWTRHKGCSWWGSTQIGAEGLGSICLGARVCVCVCLRVRVRACVCPNSSVEKSGLQSFSGAWRWNRDDCVCDSSMTRVHVKV